MRAAGCRVPTSLDALMTRLLGGQGGGVISPYREPDLFEPTAMS